YGFGEGGNWGAGLTDSPGAGGPYISTGTIGRVFWVGLFLSLSTSSNVAQLRAARSFNTRTAVAKLSDMAESFRLVITCPDHAPRGGSHSIVPETSERRNSGRTASDLGEYGKRGRGKSPRQYPRYGNRSCKCSHNFALFSKS